MRLIPLPPFVWPLRLQAHWAVLMLVSVCCLIELVLIAADWGLIGSIRWRLLALQNGAFWAGLLSNWQPNYGLQPITMFATYSGLHAGFVHLAGNMCGLLWLGPVLSDQLGQGRFLILFGLSAIGGAFGFVLLSHTPVPMVGASGAVFGLLGALVALDYLRNRDWNAVIYTTLALVLLNLLTLILERGALAWETHLGGYIAGAITLLWLAPANLVKPR